VPTLFSSPKTPSIPTPTIMPAPNDAAVMASNQQQIAAASRQSGRISTILTNPTDRGSSDQLG
jgi:hypothetical protein